MDLDEAAQAYAQSSLTNTRQQVYNFLASQPEYRDFRTKRFVKYKFPDIPHSQEMGSRVTCQVVGGLMNSHVFLITVAVGVLATITLDIGAIIGFRLGIGGESLGVPVPT